MEMRLGELLVESGVLNERQVQNILDEQRDTGEPFGILAERRFGVDPAAVEAAWARQYASITRTIDPVVEIYDECALKLITRRQAWQFRVLPIRFEPVELMMATTHIHLRRALRFATNVVGVPVFLVLAEPIPLGEALCKHYPMPSMTADSVIDAGIERLLALALNRAA